MPRAMQHDTCKLHKGNRTWKKKQVLGCISTPGRLKLLKGMMSRGILWVPNFETSIFNPLEFQPSTCHTCFKLCRSSLPQRKSDSDLGPSTGVAPWIPHGFSHGNGQKEFQHPICEDPESRSQVGPLKPMKSDLSLPRLPLRLKILLSLSSSNFRCGIFEKMMSDSSVSTVTRISHIIS